MSEHFDYFKQVQGTLKALEALDPVIDHLVALIKSVDGHPDLKAAVWSRLSRLHLPTGMPPTSMMEPAAESLRRYSKSVRRVIATFLLYRNEPMSVYDITKRSESKMSTVRGMFSTYACFERLRKDLWRMTPESYKSIADEVHGTQEASRNELLYWPS